MSTEVNIKKVLIKKYESIRKLNKEQLLKSIMDKETAELARTMQGAFEGAMHAGDEENKKAFYQATVHLHKIMMIDPIDFEAELAALKSSAQTELPLETK